MNRYSLLYRLMCAVIATFALWHGRGLVEQGDQFGAVLCWIVSTTSLTCLQLSFTLKP